MKEQYTNSGPITADVDFDKSNVRGKTAFITGGANGIGEAYTRQLVKNGAFVLIADLDQECGTALEKELSGSVKFVKTNVTQWADQLAAFKQALASSPSGRVDIVVANAGISAADSVFLNDVEQDEPDEPRLDISKINLDGVLYTTKLALFYFRKQNAANKGPPLDQVLVLQGSLAGYLDLPGAVQYAASKYALRGMFKCLRRTELQHNIRVNFIGPWFIATKILSKDVKAALTSQNVEFATVDDAAVALLKIVSNQDVIGRALAIVPRSIAPSGYLDIAIDDYDENTLLGKLQAGVTGATHRATLSPEKQQPVTSW